MLRRPPRSSRTDTLFPYTTLFRSLLFFRGITNMHPIAKGLVGLIALFSAGLMPAQAQIRAVDPNTAIDADLAPLPSENANPTPPGQDVTVESNVYNEQPASRSDERREGKEGVSTCR